MSQDITFMTPGSTWLRENGKRSVLLFVTNLTLSNKAKDKYPPQAVYLNENGDVLSQDIDNFLATRTFFNVEPVIESKVDSLLAFREDQPEEDLKESVEDSTDAEDDLQLLIDGDSDEGEMDDAELKEVMAGVLTEELYSPQGTPSSLEEDMQFVSFVGEAPAVLRDKAALLSYAVVSYAQTPIISEDLTDHVIEFDRARLDEVGISASELEALFDPEKADFLPSFAVSDNVTINWSAFIGIFPKMSKRKNLVCLHLGTLSSAAVDAAIAEKFASQGISEQEPDDVELVMENEVEPDPVALTSVTAVAPAPVTVQAAVAPAPAILVS